MENLDKEYINDYIDKAGPENIEEINEVIRKNTYLDNIKLGSETLEEIKNNNKLVEERSKIDPKIKLKYKLSYMKNLRLKKLNKK